MSYKDRKTYRSQSNQASQPAQAASKLAIAPAITPGKRTRTMNLPPQPAGARPPMQQKPDPAAQVTRWEQAELTQRWIDTAMRPDLYPPPVQRKHADQDLGQLASPSAYGNGQPRPCDVQAKREHAFAGDFSAVRIHEGPQATAMRALAYTQGTDIHFAPGQYEPRNPRGQELLGHELAHVVQQAQGRVQATTQAKGIAINADPSLEQEADRMGARAARGESVEATPGQPKRSAVTPGTAESIQAKISGSSSHVVQMSGWWATMRRGAGIYLGITLQDEGSPYAKALMRHYVLGGGSEFNPQTSSINFPTDAMWSSFMAGRPEIQRAMDVEFQSQAAAVAAGGTDSGHIHNSITGVSLNELESMRWTLHGCHRIHIDMDYSISDDGSGAKTVTFSNVQFHWIDVGDMHPGTVTETDSGELVDDADLMGAGGSFPIDIPFAAPVPSVWQVTGGTAMRVSGWPNASTATSTRYRGE